MAWPAAAPLATGWPRSGWPGSSTPIWTPAENFKLGTEPGLWYDPTSFANLSQDTTGTQPATTLDQPAGRVLDLSGCGYHATQVTVSARPKIQAPGGVQSLTFDGLDDGMSTGAVVLGSNMDCFIAIKRNSSANGVLFYNPDSTASTWVGAFSDGNATFHSGTSTGNPVITVDGNATPITTRAGLSAALSVGDWHVVQITGLNLSALWGRLGIGAYPAIPTNASIAQFLLVPAGDAAMRTKNYAHCRAKAGLA